MKNRQGKLMVIGLLLVTAASFSQAQETEEEALEPRLSTDELASMALNDADAVETVDNGNDVTDEIELSVTEITGNQELPKMLYIVPWQKSDTGDLFSKPSTTALDNALAPIDRTEFVRQVDYYGDLYGAEEE